MRFLKSSLTLAASLLASTLAAHAAGAPLPAGCGDDAVQYKVKTSSAQALPAVEAGKAQIVFIQSLDGDFSGDPVTRFAVDGNWVGAGKGDSYVVVSVTPGSHKICASRQSSSKMEKDNLGVATISASAGTTYFYNFTLTRTEMGAAMRANGGTGLSGSAPTGQTPDMTAKRRDTVDTAVFTDLTQQGATKKMKAARLSTSMVK